MLQTGRTAVGAVFFAAGSMYGTWLSRIVDIQRVLAVSPAVLGIALVGSGVGALSGNVAAALLHRQVPSRTTARLVGPPFAASLALIGMARDAVTLFLALFFCGLTYGLLNVAINLQGTAIERVEGPALPLLHGLFSLGALAGAAAGVVAASNSVTPRAHFLVVSVLILITGLVCWPALVPDAALATPSVDAVNPDRRLRQPWRLAALALAAVMAHGTVGDWSSVHLGSNLGASSGVAATGPFVLLTAAGLSQLAGNELVRRLGAGRILRLSAGVATAGLLALGLAPTVAMALVGIAVAGLGMACVVPVVTSAAGEAVDGSAASGVTLVVSVVSTTDLLGPAVVGLAASTIGLGPVFLLLALPMLAVGFGARSVGRASSAAPETEPMAPATDKELRRPAPGR